MCDRNIPIIVPTFPSKHVTIIVICPTHVTVARFTTFRILRQTPIAWQTLITVPPPTLVLQVHSPVFMLHP